MIDVKDVGNYNYLINYVINNEVIGFIRYEVVFETVNIVDVFVSETYRRKGIASLLMKYLFESVKCERFMLEVNENNLPAKKLYEKFGFKQIHIRKNYYKDGNALIMEAKK